MKRFVSIILIFSMVISLLIGFGPVSYADSGDMISCTEEEAYEKGEEYFKVWYICNKGNSARLMWGSKNNLPASSAIERARSTPWFLNEINQWRIMTFNLKDAMDHGALEEAYAEACLYDLVCNKSTVWSDGVTFGGDLDNAVSNLSLGTWAKIEKYFAEEFTQELTRLSKTSDMTVADMEKITKIMDTEMNYSKLSSVFKWADKVGTSIGYAQTLGEALEGRARLKLLLEESCDKSSILYDMRNRTDNSAYKEALSNYASYLSGVVTEDAASKIYTGTMLKQELGWFVAEQIWDKVGKKIKVLKGIEIAETTAKTTACLANVLTGNEDRYSAFEKMQVSYDMEQALWKYLDCLIYDVDRGVTDAENKFLTAYDMLKRMYEICYDNTEDYYNKCAKEGLLNLVFPGIKKDQYDQAINSLTVCRDAVNAMFDEDYTKSEEAYRLARTKYEPSEQVLQPTLPSSVNIDEEKENFEAHAEDFRLYIDKDRRLTRDMEVFGDVYLNAGNLDLNGHKLIVYGDLHLADYNETLTINGVLEVFGKVYDETAVGYSISNRIMITGGSSFLVHEDILIDFTYITVSGGQMIVDGDLLGTQNSSYSYCELLFENNGLASINGDLNFERGEVSGRTGSLSIGGNFISSSSSLGDDLDIKMTGTEDLTISNLKGGHLTVLNSDSRSINLENYVTPALFSADSTSGKISVKPLELYFGGKLDTDMKLMGDIVLYNTLDLNGKNLTITGNASHTEYSYVKINRGTLDIKGNYSIAMLDNGEYVSCSYTGLYMVNPEDHVIVGGNLLINLGDYSANNTFTDGILEVKGNFTQIGKATGFNASSNHTTWLNGSKLQRVSLEGYPSSRFNNLVLYQYEENYIFNPEECWNSLEFYCDHANKIIKNKKNVLCLEDGYSGDIYCQDCGKLIEMGKIIPAEGHKLTSTEPVQASCKAPGQTGGRICAVCGKITKAPTILPQLEHQPQAIEAIPPTCSQEGKTAGSVCTLCNEILAGCETIDAMGHSPQNLIQKASLTTNGYSQSVCSVCNEVLSSKSTIYSPKAMKLSKTSYVYAAKVQKPTVTVTNVNGKTIATSNYTVSFSSGCKNPGKYKVTVTFKGNYTGQLTASYTILPKSTSIVSLTAKSKGFTVKWNKQASQTTGYQIQYSTASSFSSPKLVTITSNTTLSKTISKLTGKKKYYVRIRTYKTVSGVKYYSAWSSSKTVTTKP